MAKARITADKVECFLRELKLGIDMSEKHSAETQQDMTQKCIQLIEKIKPICDKIESIRREYDINDDNKFNIFLSVAKKYYYETYHSEIIRCILDPKTFGSNKYLHYFIDIVKDILKSEGKAIINYDFSKDVMVEVEYSTTDKYGANGSIDIFIYDKIDDKIKYGIMIENKIHNARDTKNQLVKYMKYAEEEHIEIIAVVYLPPTIDKQPPTDDNYNKEQYAKQIEDLKKKVVVLPAISKDKKNLVDGFLVKCIRFARETNNIQAQVYIEDYMRLVKKLGGDIMSADYDKEILVKLLSDEGRPVLEKILDVWDKSYELLGEIIIDTLIEKLDYTRDEGGYAVKKHNEQISYAFCNEEGSFTFGFKHKDKPSQKVIKVLYEILSDADFKFGNDYFAVLCQKDELWTLNSFSFELDKPIDEIIKLVLDKYKLLEAKTKEALKE